VYIVTTSKRIRQITALAFVCLVFTASFTGYRFYHVSVSLPEQFRHDLATAAKGGAELLNTQYQWGLLAEQEKDRAYNGLSNDLERVDWVDAGQGAQLLLQSATTYLSEEDTFHEWLHLQLQTINMPSDQWLVESVEMTKQVINTGEVCLVIEKEAKDWQLVSFEGC